MYLVTGITGHVGGAAARRLLQQGKKVRALVRDPKKAQSWAAQGIEVRQGDLTDTATLAQAMHGVEGAFLMVPPILTPKPGFPEAQAVATSFRDAITQAQPPRVVALSSIGSQQSSRLGLITATYIMEQGLRDVSVPIAFVRAGSFMENYAYGLQTAKESGIFDVFLTPTNRTIPMIATQDIGNEVARLLLDSWQGKKVVELGSRISPDELATALGEVLGREVKARSIPRENWTPALQAQGMPAEYIRPFEEMSDSINSGWIDFTDSGNERLPGTMTPKQFFAMASQG